MKQKAQGLEPKCDEVLRIKCMVKVITAYSPDTNQAIRVCMVIFIYLCIHFTLHQCVLKNNSKSSATIYGTQRKSPRCTRQRVCAMWKPSKLYRCVSVRKHDTLAKNHETYLGVFQNPVKQNLIKNPVKQKMVFQNPVKYMAALFLCS